MSRKVTCVFEKYSKEVLVEFCRNSFWCKNAKQLKDELENIRKNIQFDKTSKELENLFEVRKELEAKKDTFKSYNDYLLEIIMVRKKIDKYMAIQDKLLKNW